MKKLSLLLLFILPVLATAQDANGKPDGGEEPSFEMSPRSADLDAPNCAWGDAKHDSDSLFCIALRQPAAYFSNVVIFQFNGMMASAANLPALGNHVGSILFCRSEKEMSRVDASRIVTFMANQDAFWDVANQEFIRKSGGFFVATLPVAVFIGASSPENTAAISDHADMPKEYLINRQFRQNDARSATEFVSPTFYEMLFDVECFAASETVALDSSKLTSHRESSIDSW